MKLFTQLNLQWRTLCLSLLLCLPLYSLANLTITAPNDTSICAEQGGLQLGVAITGGAAPYFYTWSCNSTVCALDSINDDDPQADPVSSTWYYVQVVDVNGCASNIDSIWLQINPLPMVMAGPDLFICADSAPCVVLNPTVSNASGPFTYNWFPSNGLNNSTLLSPCARPVATTDYYLQVTSGQTGCSNGPPGTDTSAFVTVVVHPVPIANAGPDQVVCLGDTVQLNGFATNAGPNYFFFWSPSVDLSNSSIPNPGAFPASTTQYSLTAFSNGCPSYPDTVTVQVNPLPTSTPTISQVMDTLYSSPADPGNGYLWCFNGQPVSGSNQPFWVPTTSGNYAVKFVTNTWGCASAPSSVLTGRAAPALSRVQVYPQPVGQAGQVKFHLEQPQAVSLHLLDAMGQEVHRQSPMELGAGTQVLRIAPGARLSAGVYVLQLRAGVELLHSQQLFMR